LVTIKRRKKIHQQSSHHHISPVDSIFVKHRELKILFISLSFYGSISKKRKEKNINEI